jgi:hypothetical protein
MNLFQDQEPMRENVDKTNTVIEYNRIRHRAAKPNKKIVVFAIGIVVGIMYFFIFGGVDIKLTEDFWKSGISANESTGMIQYIFSLRIKQLLFLLICSYSYVGNFMAYGLLCGLGFEFSLILFTFLYNFKFKGMLISMLMIFPQGIFYLLLLFLIFEKYYNGEKHSVYKEKVLLLWKIIMGVILFLLGFLCETCINFEILQKLITAISN